MAKSYEISQRRLLGIEAERKKNRNKNVERRLYVLVMRAEGKSLVEISEKTGYHISTAFYAIPYIARKNRTHPQSG